jgi:hypothetical protein
MGFEYQKLYLVISAYYITIIKYLLLQIPQIILLTSKNPIINDYKTYIKLLILARENYES